MRTLNDIHGATDDEISGYLELVQTKDFRRHVAEFSGEQRTLRDWFAGMALQGAAMFINQHDDHHEKALLDLASESFRIADSMLAARKKQP